MASFSNAKITFTDHLEDMGSLFNAIDVLVSFSGGSVMYEAMAWGKIVISIGFVNQSSSMYLIDKKTAFVIDGYSLQLARDTIMNVLLDDELFSFISAQASEIIRKSLLPKKLSKQVEKVYEIL